MLLSLRLLHVRLFFLVKKRRGALNRAKEVRSVEKRKKSRQGKLEKGMGLSKERQGGRLCSPTAAVVRDRRKVRGSRKKVMRKKKFYQGKGHPLQDVVGDADQRDSKS